MDKAKYVIKDSAFHEITGECYFVLLSPWGHEMMRSQYYSTRSAARNAIAGIQKYADTSIIEYGTEPI